MFRLFFFRFSCLVRCKKIKLSRSTKNLACVLLHTLHKIQEVEKKQASVLIRPNYKKKTFSHELISEVHCIISFAIKQTKNFLDFKIYFSSNSLENVLKLLFFELKN